MIAEETEFEPILQREMPSIVEDVVVLWDKLYACGVVDSDYSEERAVIPQMYMQFCAGYSTFYFFFTSCSSLPWTPLGVPASGPT